MEILKKREFRPKYNEDMLGVNPFLGNLEILVSEVAYKNQYKKDKDGDMIPIISEVESESKCSLFVSSQKRLKANRLSPRAKELYLWLLYEADNGKDYMWLNRVRYMSENDISSVTTYRSALKEVIMAGIITRSVVNGVYWINPDFFYNGNRIIKFPKNLKMR